MAVNFGALEDFIDDYDVEFSFGGTEYKETFSFANIAAFKAWLAGYSERAEKEAEPGEAGKHLTDAERTSAAWAGAAIILGGKFNPDKWEITGLPKNHFLNKVIADGANFEVTDRLVSSIFAKYRFNDEVAATYYKERDLGKALQIAIAAANQKANDNQETPTTTGETTGGDSETQKD